MSKQVIFTIEGGEVKIEASGFKGGACDAATKAFEEILGGPGEKKRKSEYYEKPDQIHLNAGGAR